MPATLDSDVLTAEIHAMAEAANRGRWYLNITVKVRQAPTATSDQVLGIDLGLKTAATASNGDQLTARRKPPKRRSVKPSLQ